MEPLAAIDFSAGQFRLEVPATDGVGALAANPDAVVPVTVRL